MSDYTPQPLGAVKEKDPLTRFLLGCAAVVAGLLILVIGGCGFVAWRLMRDETPGRPLEGFLLGDEERYWCADLKPDDPGIAAFDARLDQINDASRDQVLGKVGLKGLTIPANRAQLQKILPLRFEFGETQSGWSSRVALSRGDLKMRAAIKLMRFFVSRDKEGGEIVDVDGVKVTSLKSHRGGKAAALATVGNRLLLASDTDRMRRLLTSKESDAPPRLAGIAELHGSIRLAGEDAWAFAADTKVDGPTRALPLLGAVASLDLAPGDLIRFRIAVPAGDGAGLATLAPDEALAIAASFFPRIPKDGLKLDAGSPTKVGERVWQIDGALPEVSKRIQPAFMIPTGEDWKDATPLPSANPTAPSPPPTSYPRSGTPGGSPSGGTPTPRH